MIPTPRLIGLGGLKRSGKDTLAEHWHDRWGYVVMGMSEPLLDMALVLNPWINFPAPRESMLGQVSIGAPLAEIVEKEGYTKAKEYPEVRAFLQRLGTDVGREMIDQDLWIKQAAAAIRKHWSEGKSVVLTGIRFPNEIDMIRSMGGTTLSITRGTLAADDSHASETSLTPGDFTWLIENNSTLANLYSTGDEVLRQMGNEAETGDRQRERKDIQPSWMTDIEAHEFAAEYLLHHGPLTASKTGDLVGVRTFKDGATWTFQTANSLAFETLVAKHLDAITAEQRTPSEIEDDRLRAEAQPTEELSNRTDWDKESGEFGSARPTYKAVADFAKLSKVLAGPEPATPDLNSDGTQRKTPLSPRQRSHIERWKRQGRSIFIDDRGISSPGWSETKKAEQDRLVGLAEAQGWLAEVQSDGSVVTRHPIDWMVHLDYPSGYTKMTRDPHEPLECMKCGARYVNHIQHTKWHDALAQIING